LLILTGIKVYYSVGIKLAMENSIKIVYIFRFENDLIKEFTVNLDSQTLDIISEESPELPEWTRLNYSKCVNCPLDEDSNKYCPVARNLTGINEEFKDYFSYENVDVSVATNERKYVKATSLQEGLSSLIGIIMVTSGCPVLEYLKPMARFHLPFATFLETIFRTSSTYFTAQYFLRQRGKPFDVSLEGLKKIYNEIGQVNRDFSQRLADASNKDASINALVNLDCFASMIPFQLEEMLKEIESFFSAYFK
jgi:hypothetical protein